ncbi:MAG TPA: hypothetical protein VGZ22_29845 [Isosphaeraceae bacterium]|jgi:hypothetical protein|nr:hypothetical protein [Isosphaeraceae bacterium]
MAIPLHPISLERIVTAIERVRDRLARATAALEAAGVPYAVVGGNAVAAWVSRVDEAAVRFTQDVYILLQRGDLAAATAALQTAGFVGRHVAGIDLFLDGPDSKARDAVHVVYAGEKVRPEYLHSAPEMKETERHEAMRVLSLEALVRMKLTSFRRKDQVHVLDMIGVGLIDEAWLDKLPADLRPRLQELLENPES